MHSFNVFRVISRLYGWVSKTLRLSPSLMVNIVLWLCVQDWILWVANLRFPFYEICVQNQSGHKILRPSWGLRHWQFEFNYRKDRILTCFSILILEHCVENRRGGDLIVLELSVDEGWWSEAESLIQGQLKSRKFKAGNLAEAISMTPCCID